MPRRSWQQVRSVRSDTAIAAQISAIYTGWYRFAARKSSKRAITFAWCPSQHLVSVCRCGARHAIMACINSCSRALATSGRARVSGSILARRSACHQTGHWLFSRLKDLRLRRHRKLAADDRFSRRGQTVRRQGHRCPPAGAHGPMMVLRHRLAEKDNFTGRQFHAGNEASSSIGACPKAGGAVNDIIFTISSVTAPFDFDKYVDLLPRYFGPPSLQSTTVRDPTHNSGPRVERRLLASACRACSWVGVRATPRAMAIRASPGTY
jgi:hypothetical protein